jgi:hypothetical protein
MKVASGTKEVTQLLDQLRAGGNLIDVYSKEFFERLPSYAEDPDSIVTREGFEHVEEAEADPDSEVKPIGHMIFIRVDDYAKDVKAKLIELYPPLLKIMSNGGHDPDFLLLNTYSRQLLCVGLGRKNRFFAFDGASGKSINAFGLYTEDGSEDGYIDRFVEHDMFELVSDFVTAIHDLGAAMFAYDSLPANEETIEQSISGGPASDGFYYIDQEIDSSDGEAYSFDEMKEFLEEYGAQYQEMLRAINVIQIFFPKCDFEDMNTGDY